MEGVANHLARRLYTRRARRPVVAEVRGLAMELDPHELVDGLLLFAPQLHDRREIAFLARRLRPGDVFLDLGAHIGFYSLVVARMVGPAGRVIAVEPEPESFARLLSNAARNDLPIEAKQVAVSDREETRTLRVDRSGNRGSTGFLREVGEPVEVPCVPVARLLPPVVHAAKLDLEGFEHRVLASWPEDRLPGALVVEHHPGLGGDVPGWLAAHGYRVRPGSRHNLLAHRPP